MDASLLRIARQKAQLSKAELAARTKLSPRIIAALDEGRLERLPGGLYTRSFIRTYGNAVGLEPSIVEALIDTLATSEVEIATVIAVRQHAPGFDSGEQLARRRAAASVDLSLVALVCSVEVLACSLIAGLGTPDFTAGTFAAAALAVPTLISYFGLLGATGVGTLGARMFEVEFLPAVDGPLDGAALLRRTLDYLRAEVVVLLTGRGTSAAA